MNSKAYLIKVKHIVLPYLLLSFLTVISLISLRWLLFIKYPILDVREEIWNFWIPLIFPGIPLLIWIRPRLRVLQFKAKVEDCRFWLLLILWLTLTGMLYFSQNLLTTATGKLVVVNNVNEINFKNKVRYYKIKRFVVDHKYGTSYTDISVSGKYKSDFNIHLYFAAPITVPSQKRKNIVPKYWYGMEFQKTIDNRLSAAAKDIMYKEYFKECVARLSVDKYTQVDHFERLPRSSLKTNLVRAITSEFNQVPNAYYEILSPVTTSYEARNGSKAKWMILSLVIGLGIFLLLLIWPTFYEQEYKRQLAGIKPKKDDLLYALSYLIPKDGHFITSIIIDINVLIILAMLIKGYSISSPNAAELLEFGASRRTEVIEGQWWRLLTNVFLHSGILHLLSNITGIVVAAIFIEPVIGRKKYALLYLLSGLGASLCSIAYYENTVSVGASGAIFGLYGAILASMISNNYSRKFKKSVLIFFTVYIGINLFYGLLGGIDNAAHIGGLITGALLGLLNDLSDEKQKAVF